MVLDGNPEDSHTRCQARGSCWHTSALHGTSREEDSCGQAGDRGRSYLTKGGCSGPDH